jgi:serine protease Do
MARTSARWLALTMLLVGVIVGMAIDRGGRALPAHADGPAPNAEAAAAATVQVPRARPVGETAIYDELARHYEAFRSVDRMFELVATAVSPAVVHIVARKSGKHGPEGHPAHDYEESGSGVIVRPERGQGLYVLTNNHVVERAAPANIQIVLHDGRALRPTRLWSDTKADIAVLRLGRDDLPAARLGNSDEVAVGHCVMAFGSPFGLTHSVTTGIISARGRHEEELQVDGVENQDFLQTDAAINPGNSGGPLVNMKGEVIGINTAIASDGGGSEGVGFSIPINLAKWIMAQLVTTGKVTRGAMGVNLRAMNHEKARMLGLDRPRGAWVEAVWEPSPAAEAGLRGGDVILRFNGLDVIDLNHLINLVSMSPIGQAVEIVIWRDRQELVKQVPVSDQETLMATATVPTTARAQVTAPLRRPARPPQPTPKPTSMLALGLELITLNGPIARQLGLSESLRGAAILKIEPSSPLAPYFKPLDVIASAGGQPIRTAEEAARVLTQRANQNPIELGLQRRVNGAMQSRSVKIP